MNTAQELFVNEWLRTHDRIKALAAAGYQTDKRTTAMVQFRRLMQREDIKAAINPNGTRTSSPDIPEKTDELSEMIRICWDEIRDTGTTTKDRASLARLLASLRGWDKQEKETPDTLPPTFQYMPFTPSEVAEAVPE